jgi:AmiR/NasT family two-component response regulator
MAGYQRFALIFDSNTAELGRAAMRLLELGLDVLYANDVDEAVLMAQQESERLGAVLISTNTALPRVDELLSRVCSMVTGARGLVMVGLEPDPEYLEELRKRGVEWRLWEPFGERELRFVMSSAMATDHEADRRKAMRIPTEIETAVFSGRHRKDVVVHDLSEGGAYLAAQKPFLEGTMLSLDIALPEGRVVGKAEVVYAKTADQLGRPDVPVGMGILFTKLAPSAEEALSAHLDAWIERVRL